MNATAIVRTLAAAGDGDPLGMRVLTALVRAIVIACVVAAPTSADVWDGIDLWNKWPDISTSTVPDVDEMGIWAPETPVSVPGNVLYGVHAALLYDGQYERLLMMRNDAIVYDLASDSPGQPWEFDLNGTQENPVLQTPNGHEIFCSGYVQLDDGSLFIVGTTFNRSWTSFVVNENGVDVLYEGEHILDGEASIFSPFDPLDLNSADPIGACWEVTDDLPHDTGQVLGGANPSSCTSEWPENPWSLARYYPTCVRLEDGRVLVAAGDFWVDCNADMNLGEIGEIDQQNKWAIYDPEAPLGGRWSWDDNASTGPGGSFTNPWVAESGSATNPAMTSYPHMKMLPYGLFYAGNDRADAMATDPAQPSYLWTPLSEWDTPNAISVDSGKRQNRFTSTCVVLTMDATDPDISILMTGGGSNKEQFASLPKEDEGAEIITYRKDEVTGVVSAVGDGWYYTDPMGSSMGRTDGNAVLLPDGTVLVVGGEEGEGPSHQNRDCEIFTQSPTNPSAGTWVPADAIDTDRGHHSVALLLPDGRVFSSGFEALENGVSYFGQDYQIYYPPYLFETPTMWAVRDTIETWPSPQSGPDAWVSYGLPFEITLKDDDADGVDEVVLMAPCAVTHATAFSQSRIRLSHAPVGSSDPGKLIVSGPKDSTYAPEGYYLLFVLAGGVPSEGRWVKVRAPDPSQFTVPVGLTALWGGDVWLTQDFEVQGALTILAGTTVHVHADATSGSYTGGSALIDIGTALLGSIKADGVTFTTFDGTGSPDEWGGLVFNTGSTYYEPTGKYSPSGAASSVTNSTIEHAESGIRIVNRIAPTIAGNTFADNSADILIDGTDAVIPDIAYWDLEAPIAVKGTQSMTPVGDALFGTSGKTNLIAQGPLVTRDDDGPGGELVTFHPDVITPDGSPTGSNDWGGIFLDSHAAGSLLEWADIGYASNPVFVREPSDVIIRNSTIHHFASTGLWVNGAHDATSPGLVVESTIIDRGVSADIGLGRVGVFLDQATNVQFGGPGAENLVMLHGASDDAGGYGILVAQEKGTCEAAGPPETIRIANTTVVGPGVSPDPDGDWSGIRFNWVCGTADRTVELVDNWIEKCNFAGLDLEQAVDVQATCNKVVESRRGLAFSRDGASGGPGVRFRENSFEQIDEGDAAAVATDASFKVKMGPDSSDKARNVLKVWNEDVSFVQNDDSMDVLNARHNYWYLRDASGETFLDDVAQDEHMEIDKRCRTSSGVDYSADATVNVLNHMRTHDGEPECPERHPEAPSGSRIAGSGVAAGTQTPVDGTEVPVRLEAPIPTITRLGRPFPNPSSGGITVPFALALRHAGHVRLEVFDVRGRRVRVLTNQDLAAAQYRLAWSGVDESGERVSPGTYFVRFRAGDHVQTSKVTVLR